MLLTEGYNIFVKNFEHPNIDNPYFITIVIIHGGPSLSTHEELLPAFYPVAFEKVAIKSVIFYDQLGCGFSDKPNDASCYSIETFVSHLSQILRDLENVVLFGHSFGGQIAMEWLCSYFNQKVIGIIISNSPLNELTYEKKQKQLRESLDLELQSFYENEEIEIMSNGTVESLVYRTIIGVSDTNVTGSMKNWSIMDRILEASKKVPVLFITGEFDNIPFEEYEELRDSATVEIIGGAGHAPFYETPEVFWKLVKDFLERLHV